MHTITFTTAMNFMLCKPRTSSYDQILKLSMETFPLYNFLPFSIFVMQLEEQHGTQKQQFDLYYDCFSAIFYIKGHCTFYTVFAIISAQH